MWCGAAGTAAACCLFLLAASWILARKRRDPDISKQEALLHEVTFDLHHKGI